MICSWQKAEIAFSNLASASLEAEFLFVSVVRERGLGGKTERNMKGWDERDWRNERRRRRSCFFVFVFLFVRAFYVKNSKSTADS